MSKDSSRARVPGRVSSMAQTLCSPLDLVWLLSVEKFGSYRQQEPLSLSIGVSTRSPLPALESMTLLAWAFVSSSPHFPSSEGFALRKLSHEDIRRERLDTVVGFQRLWS